MTDSNSAAVDAATRGDALIASALAASLTVRDLAASTAWYRDVLGFAIDREHERNGTKIAVSLSSGPVQILVVQDNGAKGGTDRVKGEGFSMRFSTSQSIDAIAERVKSRGGVLDSEPADALGFRVFRLRDPDGFRLTISSEG
jgi:catechol 2,3-dioxygenase-like lactoylglutathione lyase family enzyme